MRRGVPSVLCARLRLSLGLVAVAGVVGCAQPAAEEQAELPAPAPRLYRLTHAQWENTVQDLFGLSEPTGLSDLFRDDPHVAGFLFDSDASTLEVDHALWTGYRLAAAEVARRVTQDPQLLERLSPGSGTPEARLDEFVHEFGLRAYRRPLSDDEAAALTDLFSAAPGLYPMVDDPFQAGIRHVVEAVLQSPDFLYRIERSTRVVDDVIPLDGYEIAQRLSYLLWNTMPDEPLFAAAADGSLTDPAEVERQTLRLLDDPRAAAMVGDFHDQLLDVGGFAGIAPSPTAFPEAPLALAALATEEQERFVRDVVFGDDGGLVELLTSTQTFVNADLAALYGLDGEFEDAFVHAELDPARRAGIFTHIGFLAANATSVDPDPIHRGVFLARRMACLEIAARPDGVPPLPPPDPDLTNRELIEAHTQQPGSVCAGCHSELINPFGFAYENYDAVGGYRTKDNGKPVDAAAVVLLGEDRVPVADALELAQAMADSQAVHECYVRHWIEYAAGRPLADEDEATIARLGEASRVDQQSIRRLLVALATSPAFLSRSATELP